MNDPIKHVYDWIEEPPVDDAERDAKEWLDRFTRPAFTKMEDGSEEWLKRHKLTVEWRSKRYECTGASRLGDVWLKKEGSSNFYDYRVDVEELSNWKRLNLPKT